MKSGPLNVCLRAGLALALGVTSAAPAAAQSASRTGELLDCSAGLQLYPKDRSLIDPELLGVLSVLETMNSGGSSAGGDIGASRQRLRDAMRSTGARSDAGPAAPDGVKRQELRIPGLKGAPPVRALVYRPEGVAGSLPAVLDIHGGAFVLGAPEGGDATNRRLAKDLGAVVVSIDYRLAPENPYPAAIDDSYAALLWMHRHAKSLGIDATKIAVMGGSAGGALAASLALRARDEGGPAIRAQMLIYPSLDDRPFTPLDPNCKPGTAKPVERAYVMYLGRTPGPSDVSAYAFAARAHSLTNLPPTFIAVGSVDGLVGQDLAYARRLIQAGVPTELHVYPGAFHGFDMAREATVTKEFYADLVDALRRALK